MFRTGKKLGKPGDDILESLMKVTDEPRVIGKPDPYAKDFREMLEEIDAKAKIKKECLDLNLNVAKTLDN